YQVREIGRFVENKKRKVYDRDQLVDEANRKTVGIFGTGLIGKEVARKAQAFDMNVVGFNTSGRPVTDFDKAYTWNQKREMIAECDFIVLLLPLAKDTGHMFGEKEFEGMKSDGYLINIGRGRHVKEKKIKGAAPDVFHKEPLPETSPLWETENIIITPHLSGKTKYFFERCIHIMGDNYKAFKENKPLTFEIDFDKGY